MKKDAMYFFMSFRENAHTAKSDQDHALIHSTHLSIPLSSILVLPSRHSVWKDLVMVISSVWVTLEVEFVDYPSACFFSRTERERGHTTSTFWASVVLDFIVYD
jgi:hypothetical protein